MVVQALTGAVLALAGNIVAQKVALKRKRVDVQVRMPVGCRKVWFVGRGGGWVLVAEVRPVALWRDDQSE